MADWCSANGVTLEHTARSRASSVIYSLVETAKANSLNPYMYLKHLFEYLPQMPDITDPESLAKLAPWYPSLPLTCRVFSR